MEEDKLKSKMTEFMTALDEVRKYKEIAIAMSDAAMIFGLSIIAALTVELFGRFSLLFFGFSFSVYPTFLLFILFLAGVICFSRVSQRIRALPEGQWRSILDEGAPGAIKILQEMKWESVFNDIRLAKVGFAVYGLVRTVVYWFFMFIILGFVISILGRLLHFGSQALPFVMGLLALVFVLFLSRKFLSRRYNQIAGLDSLLWELRWFEGEFRRADFKA